MGASGQDWSHANSCSNTIDQARLPTPKAPWLAEEALHYSHAAEPQRGGNQRRHDGGIGQTCVLRYRTYLCTYIISFSPNNVDWVYHRLSLVRRPEHAPGCSGIRIGILLEATEQRRVHGLQFPQRFVLQ